MTLLVPSDKDRLLHIIKVTGVNRLLLAQACHRGELGGHNGPLGLIRVILRA